MQPKISVILRTRQGQDNLGQCVESVLGQSLRDFELIIVNDVASEANLTLIQEYDDPRIVLYQQEGVSLGRNFGIEKASGDYLAFIDADDYWLEKKLEKQLALLEETGADVCYGWADLVDFEGGLLKAGSRSNSSGNVYGDLVLGNFLDCRSNALIRTETLNKIGGFDDTMKVAEDWDLFLRLAVTGAYVCIQEVLTFYRLTEAEAEQPVLTYNQSIQQMTDRLFSVEDKSIATYRSLILGNWNKQLLNMILEQAQNENVFVAIRGLVNAVKHDPNLWRQRMLWRAVVKISHMILPRPIQLFLFQKVALFQKVELLVESVNPILRSFNQPGAEVG